MVTDKTNWSQGKKEGKKKEGHMTASKHHSFDNLYIYEGCTFWKSGECLAKIGKKSWPKHATPAYPDTTEHLPFGFILGACPETPPTDQQRMVVFSEVKEEQKTSRAIPQGHMKRMQWFLEGLLILWIIPLFCRTSLGWRRQGVIAERDK